METPGSSADGLGDAQLCVARFSELENAESKMLEGPGFSSLASVPSVRCQEQEQRVSGSAPGGRGRQPRWGKTTS